MIRCGNGERPCQSPVLPAPKEREQQLCQQYLVKLSINVSPRPRVSQSWGHLKQRRSGCKPGWW